MPDNMVKEDVEGGALPGDSVKLFSEMVDLASKSADEYIALAEALMLKKKTDYPIDWVDSVISDAEWAQDVTDMMDGMTEEWSHFRVLLLLRNLHQLGVAMLKESETEAKEVHWQESNA